VWPSLDPPPKARLAPCACAVSDRCQGRGQRAGPTSVEKVLRQGDGFGVAAGRARSGEDVDCSNVSIFDGPVSMGFYVRSSDIYAMVLQVLFGRLQKVSPAFSL
jgi:hypothetical protein